MGSGVGLFFQSDSFNLQLQDASFDHVDLGRKRINLDTQLARRFVH